MRARGVERAGRPASKENDLAEKLASKEKGRAEKPAGRENMVPKGRVGTAHVPPAPSTRKALGDIGNLVGTVAVRGQVSKDRVTYPKQEGITTWGAKQRRSAVVVKPELVVNQAKTSSDASSSSAGTESAAAPVRRLEAFATRGQRAPSLTATLTARSAACSKHDSELLESEEQLPNIDEADIGNQLAVVDYVEDIYSFYRKAEVQSCVAPDYMSRQVDINYKMRATVIDWLIEVQQKFCLMPETLFLTTTLIDRYLSTASVSRKNLQLVGLTAMLLAAKYEEIIAPEVETIVCLSDEAYTREQVLAMEKAMLNTLRFNLTVPTPYVFMVRFLKAASSDKQMELLAFFLVELCLIEYVMVKYPPSHLAAAAVYTANQTLGRVPYWTPILVRHAGYTKSQLKDCSQMMVKFHRKVGEGKLLMVHKKYSSSKFQSVATLPPAKISDISLCDEDYSGTASRVKCFELFAKDPENLNWELSNLDKPFLPHIRTGQGGFNIYQ